VGVLLEPMGREASPFMITPHPQFPKDGPSGGGGCMFGGCYNDGVMIRVTDQYFWNFVFLVFFSLLVVMGAIILETESRIPLTDLSLTDYVLIALASWRLTRLFVYDLVTKFFREQFWDLVKAGRGYRLEKPATGPRRTIADLMACPWCFGVWATATVTFLYLITPYAIFPVVLLALSSIASFLQILSNLVGHKAEQLKKLNE